MRTPIFGMPNIRNKKLCLPLSRILRAFHVSHILIQKDIQDQKKLLKDYTDCLASKFTNLDQSIIRNKYQKQIAEKQDFTGQSLYFSHRISFDTKESISSSSDGNSYIMFIVDALTQYVALNPATHFNAYYAYTTLYKHWIAKFGLPEILVTVNGTEFININS